MNEVASYPDEIVARAGRYYRNARYVICLMALGAGLWFAYDGWVRWPAEVAHFNTLSPREQALQKAPHTELDIRLQHRLAYVLIPIAPIFLVYMLYRSRGQYRLAGNTLYVPGHPPVPLEHILGMDKTLWERKGIAHIDYHLPDKQASRMTLDDFVYEQGPTDKIIARIEEYLNPPVAQASDDQPQPSGAEPAA